MPRHKPAPGDDGLRPVTPYPGFQRQVEHPGHCRNEKPGAGRDDEKAQGVADGSEVAAAQPQTHLQHEHHGRQPESSFPVPSSQAVVFSRQRGRADQQRNQQAQPDDSANPLADGLFLGVRDAFRLGPVADEREEHWLAMKRRRFYAQWTRRVRPGSSPCHARVGVGQRCPGGLSRLKLRWIQTGGGEKYVPVERSRRRGSAYFFLFLLLRRDRLEVRQSPLRIKLQIDHARQHGGRICPSHDSRRQLLIAEIARHQRIRALPVPVLQQRRPRAEHCIPVWRLVVFLHVVLEVAVIVEVEGAVRGAALIPQVGNDLVGLLCQNFRS